MRTLDFVSPLLTSLSRRLPSTAFPLLLYPYLAAAAIFTQGLATADTWPADSGTPIWYGREPSGIVWHERLEKLYWVDDGGRIYEMNADGSAVKYWPASGSFGDLEGIAIADPSSDYVYIGVEQPNVYIKEFNISSGELTDKSWRLEDMEGHDNSGLEALTFVPNGAQSYKVSNSGGLFYAGLQDDGKIYVFDINLSKSGDVTYIHTITPVSGRSDLSGLHYHAETGRLYALFDSYGLLREMETDGTFIVEYNLPGGAQEEGITLVPSYSTTATDIYIAQDTTSREIIHYGSYPVTWGDSDGDGLINPEETDTYQTDPYDADSDDDGVSDYDEVWYDGDSGYDPYDPGSETGTDTDANSVDTDDDGYCDCVEITDNGNPINAGQTPTGAKINFQPSSSAQPSGYCPDFGDPYSLTNYGW